MKKLKRINIITNVLNVAEDHVDRKKTIDAIKKDLVFAPIPNKRNEKVCELQFSFTIVYYHQWPLHQQDQKKIDGQSRLQRDVKPAELEVFQLDKLIKHLGELCRGTPEGCSVPEGYLLVSPKGAVKQDDHVDFKEVFNYVTDHSLCAKAKLPQLPYSLIVPLSKSGFDLFFTEYSTHVHVNYGDCLMWRGDVKHSGMGYKEFNLRFFTYLETTEFPHDFSVFFLKDD